MLLIAISVFVGGSSFLYLLVSAHQAFPRFFYGRFSERMLDKTKTAAELFSGSEWRLIQLRILAFLVPEAVGVLAISRLILAFVSSN